MLAGHRTVCHTEVTDTFVILSQLNCKRAAMVRKEIPPREDLYCILQKMIVTKLLIILWAVLLRISGS